MNTKLCKAFSRHILKWSNKNPRDLPWDEYNDPYKVWATEIMLQQTTVSQATMYIHRFFKTFPNLKSLAQASEEEVLKVWEGLGYYSRARNLHFTARYINETLEGMFPDNYSDLLKLKGVGPYTAAAIASFCFEEAVAVLDGNVSRVLSRFFAIQEPINENKTITLLRSLAKECLGENNSALYNQAIMNFGAIQCKPRNPDCMNCPLNSTCIAHKESLVSELPFKSKKIKKRKRYFEFLVIFDKQKIYIEKREAKDIWKHLWQFPLIEVDAFLEERLLKNKIKEYLGLQKINLILGADSIKQELTHQSIKSRFHLLFLNGDSSEILKSYKRIKINELSDYPAPKTIAQFLSNNNLSLVGKKIFKPINERTQ